MKNKLFMFLGGVALFATIFAKNINNNTNSPVYIQAGDDEPLRVLLQDPVSPTQTREVFDIITDDFEGAIDWDLGGGWQTSTDEYNSATTSMWSPQASEAMSFDLLSPTYSLPSLGDGESMHFGFHLNVDMPDSDGDGDNGLEDYYSVAILDLDALAWHVSNYNELNGSNFWAADESVGGYLDSWIQYLDTPSITVGSGGEVSANLFYALEDPAGADGAIAGSCTNGWDSANVRVSADGGETWALLEDSSNSYDFDCAYGWIWNDGEYDAGGSLHHLASGWGGLSGDWFSFNADLSSYAGQDVIVRFAFGSDPAYSTIDDTSITGFQVDDIVISDDSGVVYTNDASNDESVAISGEVWVDQFYDYWDDGTAYDPRPGSNGWEEYMQGYPFNGNIFLDISNFEGKDVVFRFQTRYDDNDDGGSGEGFFFDDFRIYKISGGNYSAPSDLTVEAGNESAFLSWNDMNLSGQDDFIYDDDSLEELISMVDEDAEGWAGSSFSLAGGSTVNSVSIYHDGASNVTAYDMQVCMFGTFGTLFSPDPIACESVNTSTFTDGWNEIAVNNDWSAVGSYIIAHSFSNAYGASLDMNADFNNNHSYFNYTGNGGLSAWNSELSSDGSFEGEWGIRANITYESANVTYNVYRDGQVVASDLENNEYDDTGLMNNTSYIYEVTATYSDGEESGPSNSVEVTPQAQTVYEASVDDGSAESALEIGSGNFVAVKFNANNSGEDIVRFKWYQIGDGGAFYIKLFEDAADQPGEETFSRVVAGGLVDGWNEFDLLSDELSVSGDFWVGIKAFSSTADIGVDTSSSGSSRYSQGTGNWDYYNDGNFMIRLLLDEGEGGGSCDAGDVNSDGSINVLDVVTMVNLILGVEPSDDEACAADFNSDGAIDVLDIVSVVNVIMGN